ncbi:unnamed protein product [Prorocentrum cordatum]|uniref:Uncharacterized protein n=1 Tax=Prorocentrum cordatum TaxID=2364126 RepID=A0ABN9S804_9DINO|nr:unnamed protein product [Polarella glacialis]
MRGRRRRGGGGGETKEAAQEGGGGRGRARQEGEEEEEAEAGSNESTAAVQQSSGSTLRIRRPELTYSGSAVKQSAAPERATRCAGADLQCPRARSHRPLAQVVRWWRGSACSTCRKHRRHTSEG